MRKMQLVLLVGCTALCGLLHAQEPDKREFGVGIDYMGKYIWRGQNLQDDGALQPSFSFTYGSLSGSIWGSIELGNDNDNEWELTEVDYSIDWTDQLGDLEGVAYSLGVINYTFPHTGVDDTTEMYVGLSFELPLNPSVTLYHDVDEVDGTYISFAVGHSIAEIAELAPDVPVGLELAASLGWGSEGYNKAYWGISDGRVNDLALSMAFPFDVGGWSISPSINYVTLMDSAIRATDSYSRDSDYVFAGISLSKTF